MNNIDLNLDNYELRDLLNLFNLSYNFDEAQLKSAKKIVLKTHPDKSKLPKEYFLFFSKAYKIIYSIYEFRVKGKGSTEYVVNDENNEALKKIANNKNFNKIFNKLFEKYNIKDEDFEKGYGEWLKSDDDINNIKTTKENMNTTFNNLKETAYNSIINNTYSDLETKVYKDLLGNAPETYSANIFSSLCYEDLRKAHTENVVPVCDKNINTFDNIEHLRQHRNNQNVKPTSMSESKEILYAQKNNEMKTDVERAYKLAKQDEMYKRVNNNVLSNLYKLTNSNY